METEETGSTGLDAKSAEPVLAIPISGVIWGVPFAQAVPIPQTRPICSFEGCTRHTHGGRSWCRIHRAGKEHLCIVVGCTNRVAYKGARGPYCAPCAKTHHYDPDHKKNARDPILEVVVRLHRDSGLRDRMLDKIAEAQGNKCAAPMLTCWFVNDGKPTSRCPFQSLEVPEDMQELDHIVPYCQTQDDRRENLQMLCACCHAAKSRREARRDKLYI